MLTTSCTAALELSALLLDLQPGDTVIVPSFTFSTSALAFAAQGARLALLRHRADDASGSTRSTSPSSSTTRVRAVVRRPLRRDRLRPRRASEGAGRTGPTWR